jgi:hypothetical protein
LAGDVAGAQHDDFLTLHGIPSHPGFGTGFPRANSVAVEDFDTVVGKLDENSQLEA